MHFWIDKRSQACGFNGRHGVPASLASGRRRNKSMVTPVHRFQSTESATVAQQLRRPYQQHMSQPRPGNHQSTQSQSPVLSNEPVNGSIISRPTPPPELDASVYLDAPLEGALDTVSHAQFTRLGGVAKYGMWAFFGLTTVSVAAAKFYVDHQGTFEILWLCTLGLLSAGVLVSCILAACKRNISQQFVNVQPPPPQPAVIEMEIPEMMPQREIIITPMNNSIAQQATAEVRPTQDLEQPPPPYHIAVLLPMKENSCTDFPPPTYENAVR